MRVFHCNHCDHLVFFENTHCVQCSHTLAFVPGVMEMVSFDADADGMLVSPHPQTGGRRFRLCANYAGAHVCNWTVEADDASALCHACRLTTTIPDLSMAEHRTLWYKMETAKRRLLYTVLNLHLPTTPKTDWEEGLEFRFLADPPDGTSPVVTGHANGVITINLAEADDAERERRRRLLGEPYRTLLGHFRHEVGHYYWTRLIAPQQPRLDAFRARFGDEREDYGAALQRHYEQGAPADWQTHFVTAYASAHPWEDWAETWAHYLHVTDTLETAAACGVSLRPTRRDEPRLPKVPETAGTPDTPFDRLVASWYPLTYVLNNFNRGLGIADAYPFVLSPVAIDKVRFVHELITAVD